MSEAAIHGWIVLGMIAAAAVTFVLLLFVSAPYGRHARSGWGPTVPYRLGWVLMECPAVLAFGGLFLMGSLRAEPVPVMLAGLWLLHYVYRTFLYPFRTRAAGKSTPASVVLMGFTFNALNAYINARWISELGPYAGRSLTDVWLWVGTAVFLGGWLLNQQSDRTLIRLRKPGTTGYSIPHGGAFAWVSCPNYLGEILEWIGFAIAARSGAALAFAIFTFANLAPRAITHHRWYRTTFPDYPTDRRALIPYLL
jgi:hypothetical protein